MSDKNTKDHNTARPFLAIGIVCLGWLSLSLLDASYKILVYSLPVPAMLTVTSFISVVVTGGIILFRNGPKGFLSPNLKWHLVRAVFSGSNAFCVPYALKEISLANFYGIIFLTPLLASVLSVFLLKETLGIRRLAAILIGFVGVIILAGPQWQAAPVGFAITFFAAILVSGNILCARKIGPGDSPLLYAFYPLLFIFVTQVWRGAPDVPSMFQSGEALYLGILLSAPLFIICGNIFFGIGHALARDTASIAPFHYTQMIWGLIFGFFLFGDIPGPETVAGAGLIIGAGLYVIWREKQIRDL